MKLQISFLNYLHKHHQSFYIYGPFVKDWILTCYYYKYDPFDIHTVDILKPKTMSLIMNFIYEPQAIQEIEKYYQVCKKKTCYIITSLETNQSFLLHIHNRPLPNISIDKIYYDSYHGLLLDSIYFQQYYLKHSKQVKNKSIPYKSLVKHKVIDFILEDYMNKKIVIDPHKIKQDLRYINQYIKKHYIIENGCFFHTLYKKDICSVCRGNIRGMCIKLFCKCKVYYHTICFFQYVDSRVSHSFYQKIPCITCKKLFYFKN